MVANMLAIAPDGGEPLRTDVDTISLQVGLVSTEESKPVRGSSR